MRTKLGLITGQRTYPALGAAALLLALVLRLHLLAENSVWWDEGLAAWAARQDVLSIARWTSTDVHPPLYFWLLHVWRLLVGESEFGLRFLSLLAGVLLVAVAFALGRMVGGGRVGLLAAGLAAIEPSLVWWSQEMRMYELAALLVTLSLLFTVRLTGAPASPGQRLFLWIGYILVTAAALYTLYIAAVVVVLEAAYVALWAVGNKQRRREPIGWVLAMGITLALVLPWLIYALQRMRSWTSSVPFDGALFVRLYVAILGMGVSTNVERYVWPSLVFVAVAVVAFTGLVVTRRRHDWLRIALLLACVVVLPLLVFALTLPRGLFYTPKVEARYLVLFAPALYVLLAWGLATLERRLATVAALVLAALAVGGLFTYYGDRYRADDYQTLVSTIRAYARRGDAVVLHSDSDWPVFAYHYDGDWSGIPYRENVTLGSVASRLEAMVNDHIAVWLVVTPDALRIDPRGQVEGYLQQRMVQQTEYVVGDKRLVLFSRDGEQRPAQVTPKTRPLNVDLGNGLALVGYEQPLSRLRPGDRAYMALYWRGDGCGASVPVDLLGAGGQVVALPDVAMCGQAGATGIERTLASFVVSPQWPAGDYRLRVGGAAVGRFIMLPATAPTSGALPLSSRPLRVDFAGKIALRGFDIDPDGGDVHPGQQVKVTLYWQAPAVLDTSYTVFVHLLGQVYNARSGDFVWGQHDSVPVNGAFPTTSWPPGVMMVDQHVFTVDSQAPAGDYIIEVGLYDAVTPPYPRLTVRDSSGMQGEDRVILQTLRVGN